jgi:hypothetical protein
MPCGTIGLRTRPQPMLWVTLHRVRTSAHSSMAKLTHGAVRLGYVQISVGVDRVRRCLERGASGAPPRLLRSPAQLVIGVAAATNPGADADGHQHRSDHDPGNIRHLFLPFASSGQFVVAPRVVDPNRPLRAPPSSPPCGGSQSPNGRWPRRCRGIVKPADCGAPTGVNTTAAGPAAPTAVAAFVAIRGNRDRSTCAMSIPPVLMTSAELTTIQSVQSTDFTPMERSVPVATSPSPRGPIMGGKRSETIRRQLMRPEPAVRVRRRRRHSQFEIPLSSSARHASVRQGLRHCRRSRENHIVAPLMCRLAHYRQWCWDSVPNKW